MFEIGEIVRLKNEEKGLGRIYSYSEEYKKYLINYQFYNDNYKKVIYGCINWFSEDELEKTDIKFWDFCLNYCVFNDREHYKSCCGVPNNCEGNLNKNLCMFKNYKEEYPYHITYSDDEVLLWCRYCEKHFKIPSFNRFKEWINTNKRDNFKFEINYLCPNCNRNNLYELHLCHFLWNKRL